MIYVFFFMCIIPLILLACIKIHEKFFLTQNTLQYTSEMREKLHPIKQDLLLVKFDNAWRVICNLNSGRKTPYYDMWQIPIDPENICRVEVERCYERDVVVWREIDLGAYTWVTEEN